VKPPYVSYRTSADLGDHRLCGRKIVARNCRSNFADNKLRARATHLRVPALRRADARHRDLRAPSTSAGRRALRFHNERDRINQHNFLGGICLNGAVPSSHRLVLQIVRALPLPSPLARSVPLRAWLATDSHRSRSPDYLRLRGLCRRSNPHRSATLLIGISTSPRFPPAPSRWLGLAKSACDCPTEPRRARPDDAHMLSITLVGLSGRMRPAFRQLTYRGRTNRSKYPVPSARRGVGHHTPPRPDLQGQTT
jgi:hypothetical protein